MNAEADVTGRVGVPPSGRGGSAVERARTCLGWTAGWRRRRPQARPISRSPRASGPDPVVQGGKLTYTIRVENLGIGGMADATDVTVTDTLPGQVDFVSASSPDGTCQRAGSTVTCDLGNVNAARCCDGDDRGQAQKSGNLSNTATVTTTVVDGVTTNNEDTESTVVSKKPGKPGQPKGQSCAAPTITGTPGNDTLTGTKQKDVIVALGGSDRVFAGDGKDLVCANGGVDLVSGGPKDDVIIGGAGRDRLFGNTGKDVLKGKGGRDRLRGNADDDFLNGGRSRDSCRGGAGVDVLRRCP